jgi:uncharacterized protein
MLKNYSVSIIAAIACNTYVLSRLRGMNDNGKTFEIRDPIYGFITFDDWEREIIQHPAFQRLRRIRQLGMTDMVYPGAMHTRFEHSLGVMHVATMMFDKIVEKRKQFLESELYYDDAGLRHDRRLVRLSALLHDIGHAPFSHVSECLMEQNPKTKKPFKHENYSAAIVAYLMKDVIEDHKLNQNYHIKVKDISDFLDGNPKVGRCLIWRDLISSQLDADRADYLLRDSHHAGVMYGKYDLSRIISTLTIAIDPETESPVLAVEDGGAHAAEALIIARYMMFTQVYFHHTRRIYDYHITEVMKELLKASSDGSCNNSVKHLPPPISKANIDAYLKWDDWVVLGMIRDKKAGNHGDIILSRDHYRRVYYTSETPTEQELDMTLAIQNALGDHVGCVDSASQSWYKFDSSDVPLVENIGQSDEHFLTLSRRSSVVSGLKKVDLRSIYVPIKYQAESLKIVSSVRSRREPTHE